MKFVQFQYREYFDIGGHRVECLLYTTFFHHSEHVHGTLSYSDTFEYPLDAIGPTTIVAALYLYPASSQIHARAHTRSLIYVWLWYFDPLFYSANANEQQQRQYQQQN